MIIRLRAIGCVVAVLSLGTGAQGQTPRAVFSIVGEESGIGFVHENGASPDKYMPETMGSGVVIFDYDNDGWSDILFLNGGSFVDRNAAGSARHRLFRNRADGTIAFEEATGEAGLATSGYGMGACSADYDNDGWNDVYITGVGPNFLFRNTGDGSFVDVTATARVGSDVWSASCAFGDIDNDGDLDLYVTNYVDFTPENNKYCGNIQNVRFYCHPNIYNGVSDVLYRNEGDGTFTDISSEAGIETAEGKGLGVVFLDYDNDGWADIYVANDSVPNFLYRNQGGGVFEETGLAAGVAVGADGRPLAGMGTDAGDMNGDGALDLVVTNLDRETHSLYSNFEGRFFVDRTYESGVGEATLPYVGFGAVFFDYDNDTDLDLGIVNGDVLDNVRLLRENASHEQPNLLLRNDGHGRFAVDEDAGPAFALRKVSRSMAVGDLDRDGDLDVIVTNNGQTPDVLRNESDSGNVLFVRLAGVSSNRNGIGARLRLSVGGKTLLRQVVAGSSYLGQNELVAHFGMGTAQTAGRLEVVWPGGGTDVVEGIDANQMVTIEEGAGLVSAMPLTRPVP